MNRSTEMFDQMHELLSILQFIDVGLVLLDRDYRVSLWNGFMENHSGIRSMEASGRNIFELFPDMPEQWLKRKIDAVFALNNRSFSVWKQHPHPMKFRSYRPITGGSEWMYQNVTLFPLVSLSGDVRKVCLIVYDVTDAALRELAIKAVNEELQELSQIDGLTQLFNRRVWEEHLAMEFKRLRRNGGPSTLVLFDIDHFKQVNDTHGHQAGDRVIRDVAAELRQQKRETDIAGRYGGEEFGVILPDTDVEGGRVFSERLRKAVEQRVITTSGNTRIRVTISLGVAPFEGGFSSHEAWLEAADQALYRSKEGGRNRTTLHRPG